MKLLLRLRVVLTLFAAVLMPLELGHCALMPLQAAAVASESGHDADGDHDCCPESTPSPGPTSPTDACCCGQFQLPAVAAPVAVSVGAPTSVATPFALVPTMATTTQAQGTFTLLEPGARTGSPPDPSTSPQSPRGPPSFA